jgi:hypothetical protein
LPWKRASLSSTSETLPVFTSHGQPHRVSLPNPHREIFRDIIQEQGEKSINVSDSNVPRNITCLSLPKFALSTITFPTISLPLRYFMMIDRHAAWRWNCKLILRHLVRYHSRIDRGPRLWFTRAKPTIPLALLKLSYTLTLLFTSHLLIQGSP